MDIKAFKMDGLGNDFVIIDQRSQDFNLNKDQIIKVCDRNFIGCDQLILINKNKEIKFDGKSINPMITYGTNPGMGIGISKEIPLAKNQDGGVETYKKSLNYMNFGEGEKMIGKNIDFVFLGSCTNGRIEDFREFTKIVKGRKKAPNVTAWLVPGSHKVEKAIKEEGLLEVLIESGFKLREPGCSACLAMNDDKIPNGKYAVSTSNRNFEGRQGPGSRTLLASPLVAAAAAITGKITDPRTLY